MTCTVDCGLITGVSLPLWNINRINRRHAPDFVCESGCGKGMLSQEATHRRRAGLNYAWAFRLFAYWLPSLYAAFGFWAPIDSQTRTFLEDRTPESDCQHHVNFTSLYNTLLCMLADMY